MNFLEALQTGKKIRRKDRAWFDSMGNLFAFSRADLLATDWEVEREPKVAWAYFSSERNSEYPHGYVSVWRMSPPHEGDKTPYVKMKEVFE